MPGITRVERLGTEKVGRLLWEMSSQTTNQASTVLELHLHLPSDYLGKACFTYPTRACQRD
jgi:hypothetical protein